jgi:hypothetical protein
MTPTIEGESALGKPPESHMPGRRRLLAFIVLVLLTAAVASAMRYAAREQDALTASIQRLRDYAGARLPELPVATSDAREVPLDRLLPEADRLIVIFVRKGCPRCQELLESLEATAAVADPAAAVAIVEVGPGAHSLPPSAARLPWVLVRDEQSRYKTVLGGRVVPVLMVLDRERRVQAVHVGDESTRGLEWVKPLWASLSPGRNP